MTILRRTLPMTVEPVGDRQVRLRASTESLGRDGLIVVTSGIDLSAYRANPIMLFQHDPMHPVASASEVAIDGTDLVVLADFPPAGISRKADETCGLVKAGVLRGISTGFQPTSEPVPLDPKRPNRGPQAIPTSELYEISFVSIPAVRDALVTERAAKAADWKVGAAKDLPIEDSDAWDGAAAEASIFEWAGGDDFDSAKAKRGFLAYDSCERRSSRLIQAAYRACRRRRSQSS